MSDWFEKAAEKMRKHFKKQREITRELNRKNKAGYSRILRGLDGKNTSSNTKRKKKASKNDSKNSTFDGDRFEQNGTENKSEIIQKTSG